MAFPFGGRRLVGNIRCETDFIGWKGLWRRIFGAAFNPWLSNSRKALAGGSGFVIYNGIEAPANETPLMPEMPQPTFAILASGHPKKGHRFAIKLWERLGRPGSLIFAGDLGPELKALAESKGVVCPGYVDAGALLRSIDMLWIPSRAEGIPTVALEAMARGVPILATPAGGIAEIMRHGWNGFLLPRRRWELFLRSIDWENAQAVGERGRQEVLSKYPIERTVRRFRAAAWLAMRHTAGRSISPP
jgi:glycosyltransferase involved in cell wall biosynthesis